MNNDDFYSMEKIDDVTYSYTEPLAMFTVEETTHKDGNSEYNIYDLDGYHIGNFEDTPLTEEERKNFGKGESKIYKRCLDIVDEYNGFDSKLYKDDYDWWRDYQDADYPYAIDKYMPKQETPEERAAREKAEEEEIESLCKSDTIVFHQTDKTTVMLDPIYEGRGWDVYKGTGWGRSREFFHKLFERHDKILFLGHGTPHGLLSGCVGTEDAPYLKDKKIFALWCYAATYFKNNGFKGKGIFCSDNCPSEVWECRAACDANVSAEWIYNNMCYLSECIKNVIDLTWENPEEACRRAKEAYSQSEATTRDEKKVVEFNTNTLQVV